MPPFTVQYLCPADSPFWQISVSGKQFEDFRAAVLTAINLRPKTELGRARVLDRFGNVVYEC